MEDMMANYWMLVGSRACVRAGVEGGYIEARDGLRRPLRELQRGDGIVFYSPHEGPGSKRPCQRFTAIGTVTGDAIYRTGRGDGRVVYRKPALYLPFREVPLWPLLDDLAFVHDERGWSRSLRSGLRQISERDFELIRAAMQASPQTAERVVPKRAA